MYKRNMLVNYSLFQVQIILWWYSTLPDYLLSQKVWFLFPGMICPIQCLSALDINFWRSLLFLWPQLLIKAICEIVRCISLLSLSKKKRPAVIDNALLGVSFWGKRSREENSVNKSCCVTMQIFISNCKRDVTTQSNK